MASYLDILRPNVLTDVVKQVVASADPIINFMGFQPGGANERSFGHGREGTYHIFDDSRKLAKSRAPGTAAGRSAKQPMKAVPFVYPRMHDSFTLLAEFFHNIAKISDPVNRDVAGADMIKRQSDTLMQRAANWRIAMTVGMLRDSLYIQEDGDDWHINYTSTSSYTQHEFKVPSGNKSQLNMTDRAGTSVHGASIIDVPWTSPGANILKQFAMINQARSAQGVGPVKHVHCNSILWQYLINNDTLANVAGIANPPFQRYERVVGARPDGSPMHEYTGEFLALPGVTFHITDEGLELWDAANSVYSFTKHFPDTMAVLMGDPNANKKYTMYLGSEPIAEYDGGPETVRTGLSSWSKKVSNPTGTEIYVLDNALAVPHDPYDLDIATVSGF
jgi:hypothetical protein